MSEIVPHLQTYARNTVWDIQEALVPYGFLWDIANAKVAGGLPEDASPDDVAEVIVPDPRRLAEEASSLSPRWTLAEEAVATPAMAAVINRRQAVILEWADLVGMRLPRTADAPDDTVHLIDPDRAEFVIEGGANRTSVIRRGVALQAMRAVYGEELGKTYVRRGGRVQPLYATQFGSDRRIKPLRADGTSNPEHQVMRELIPELGETDELTEFEANVATATADGWRVIEGSLPRVGRRMHLRTYREHDDRPDLVAVQPATPNFSAALDTLDLDEKQLVIVTNGQYRPKNYLQAALWAAERGHQPLTDLKVLGDEPGDTFTYRDTKLTVPERPPAAYVNELVILWRLAKRVLASRSDS